MASSKRPTIARGDVWVVHLDPVIGSEQAKTRPCVVVQRDVANQVSRTTIVVPITDAGRHAATIIRPHLEPGEGGLTKASAALCNQVRTVDRLRFQRRLGRLAPQSYERVTVGLSEILDLDRTGSR